MQHNAESARQYIEQKRIVQLAQALTTAVAYSKPDDPVEFLKTVLTDLKNARDSNEPIFVCFTEENVKSMFAVLDPFEKGTVSGAQMEGALKNFGVEIEIIRDLVSDPEKRYTLDEFSQTIQIGIKQTLFPENE